MTDVQEVVLTDEQNAVVEYLLSFPKPIQTLGGWAGCGKSTVIKTLLDRLPGWAACSFTGKAANVLRRKGVLASTIHSLIYSPSEHVVKDEDGNPILDDKDKPLLQVIYSQKPTDQIGVEGFLVDEASMISGRLHEALTSYGLPIIYVGDHGQLEPVGDKFNLMEYPDVTLETIHRNAGEIAHFAEWLREGNPASAWRGSGRKVRVVSSLQKVRRLDPDQIICAYNKTRVALNQSVREHRGLGTDPPSNLPVPTDRVMCLKNDRELGLFNGMQGVVRAVEHDWLLFEDEDGKIKRVRFDPEAFGRERMPEYQSDRRGRIPFDWAYCVTAHKSQGSEWDDVLAIEQRCRHWSHERWCYTVASRSKKLLTWVTG